MRLPSQGMRGVASRCPPLRAGRRRYYDLFSRFYDAFIKLHARRDEEDTRHFLVRSANLDRKPAARILDICCGTGSVILAFAEQYKAGLFIGLDFSHGMLRKAMEKARATTAIFVEGDAAALPFADNCLDVVTCSHALYELKGQVRLEALREMKRVVRPDGVVLLMEHEVPRHPLVRLLFYLRISSMGSEDAREFIKGGLKPLKAVFPEVYLSHTPSGKSRLLKCKK